MEISGQIQIADLLAQERQRLLQAVEKAVTDAGEQVGGKTPGAPQPPTSATQPPISATQPPVPPAPAPAPTPAPPPASPHRRYITIPLPLTGEIGRVLGEIKEWAGVFALALVLCGYQGGGCHLPHFPPIPWPTPGPAPTPNDPFASTLQAAFSSEAATDKPKLPLLVSVYVDGKTIAADPTITTAAALLTAMHNRAQAAIGDSLPNARKAIAAELKNKLPTQPAAALDDPTRKACADQFARMAALLGKLK